MVIINKGADYSALGLGRLFIPISEETENELKGFSAITQEQKEKFQNFKDEIGTELWGKINIISMPLFASNADECYINAKDNSKFSVRTPSSIHFNSSLKTVYWDADAGSRLMGMPIQNTIAVLTVKGEGWSCNFAGANNSSSGSSINYYSSAERYVSMTTDGTNVISLTDTMNKTGSIYRPNDVQDISKVAEGYQVCILGATMTLEDLKKLKDAVLENFG